MPETRQTTHLPFSMELIAGAVAEKCYTNGKLRDQLRADPLKAISALINEKTAKPFDLNKTLPNAKVHALPNTNKCWHIVLPYEHKEEQLSEDNGMISEENLKEVVGGIFGVAALGSAVAAAAAVGATLLLPIGSIGTITAVSAGGATASAGILLSSGAIAGITAGIVAGGVALTAGVTVGAIAGLDAAGIIDTW